MEVPREAGAGYCVGKVVPGLLAATRPAITVGLPLLGIYDGLGEGRSVGGLDYPHGAG